MASKRTPEQDQEVARQISAEVLAGGGNREIARKVGCSPATVSKYKAQALAVDVIDQEWRTYVASEAKALAKETLGAMHAQLECLGDRDWITAQSASVFGLAGSYRILGETLGRLLAALDATSDRPQSA